MPKIEDTEEIETEEDEQEEGEGDPNVPDPVETLAALNEERKAHHVRLGATIPALVAQLNGDSPEHALLRALALEMSETVIGLVADVTDATTEALIQFREWADNEIEPWLEELQDDVEAGGGDAGIAEDEAVLPVAVVQSTSTNLGALRTMIEGAIAQAASPEQRVQLEAMREEVDRNLAALAEALTEPEPEPEAAAAPAS